MDTGLLQQCERPETLVAHETAVTASDAQMSVQEYQSRSTLSVKACGYEDGAQHLV